MPKILRVVTPNESVEFESANVVVRHKTEGVQITPSRLGENELGFLTLFYPWGEIKQIKEFEKP